jgi:hypothetical protein
MKERAVVTTDKNRRAAIGALIGAGVFGLVPHPMACLESYRRARREPYLFGEEVRLPQRDAQDANTREQIARPRHELENAGMGGGVQ